MQDKGSLKVGRMAMTFDRLDLGRTSSNFEDGFKNNLLVKCMASLGQMTDEIRHFLAIPCTAGCLTVSLATNC